MMKENSNKSDRDYQGTVLMSELSALLEMQDDDQVITVWFPDWEVKHNEWNNI